MPGRNTRFFHSKYTHPGETGFYYLQSRYYDPALGRFLNADSYASTGQGFLGYNMYAYCENNPTSTADHCGQRPEIEDWGIEGCWSGMSDEEATYLFACCYTKTYGCPYSCPSGHHLSVSYHIGGRTEFERKADVGALAAISWALSQFIPFVREHVWISFAAAIVGSWVSDDIVEDINEKRIFRVDEWNSTGGKKAWDSL